MKKAFILLALLLLFAGCGKAPRGSVKRAANEEKSAGGSISVKFLDLPAEIPAGKRKYLRIEVESLRDIEDVELSIYRPIRGTCSGERDLGRMKKGERREISCYIEPERNGSFEARWEALYRIAEDGAELNVTIYDENEAGGGGMERENFRSVDGYFSVFPSAAVEGTSFRFEAEIRDRRLAESSGCWCSIERALIEVPQGFMIEGLEGWRKRDCGQAVCYVKENLEGLDEEFYGRMRVTKTSSFGIKLKLFNIWMKEEGKRTVKVS